MPRSYSQDLREKLMSQLESGRLTQGQAGGLFSVLHRALGRAGISYKKNLLVPGEGPRGSWGVSLGTPEDPRRAAPLHGRAGSR